MTQKHFAKSFFLKNLKLIEKQFRSKNVWSDPEVLKSNIWILSKKVPIHKHASSFIVRKVFYNEDKYE